ncbi:MAG: sigma-70 family RNA polymerase sigma factor [Planctomycetes bacterium]|nr:sigma-70 family RNA polymerase sigma factor [Planctomycetota bacterium]
MVEGFLSGSREECFERLVERYKDKVLRLAVSVMGPGFSAEAEDITQEVFIQVFKKLSTFRGESRFATWIFRIAYNKALECRQKARFRIPHQGEQALGNLAAPAENNNPAMHAEKAQSIRAVLQSLDALEEPCRTAIYLYYWMKCSVSEIAECLEAPPGTIKSYLHRGRKRLARILGKDLEDG